MLYSREFAAQKINNSFRKHQPKRNHQVCFVLMFCLAAENFTEEEVPLMY